MLGRICSIESRSLRIEPKVGRETQMMVSDFLLGDISSLMGICYHCEIVMGFGTWSFLLLLFLS